MKQGSFFKIIRLCLLFLSSILVACGGGGGGATGTVTPTGVATVSGSALAGAPIAGIVYLRDANGVTLNSAIGEDGSFTFNVTGLTPPFFLRAQGIVGGRSVDETSVATGSGRANISPLTTIITARALGVSDPAAAYNNPGSFSATATQANLNTAVGDMRTMLQTLLTNFNAATANPLTDAVLPNQTGIDRMLDNIRVRVNSSTGAVTVTDLTGNVLASGNTLTTLSTSPAGTVTLADVRDDITAISAMLSSYRNMLNARMGSLTVADLEPYFATAYGINYGLDRTSSIAKESQNVPTVRDGSAYTSLTNVSIAGVLTAGSRYVITAFFSCDNGTWGTNQYYVVKEGGQWKFVGSGRKAAIHIEATTFAWSKPDNSRQLESGVYVDIRDPGGYGLKSAVLSVKGVGYILNMGNYGYMELTSQSAIPTHNPLMIVLSDNQIDSLSDNEVGAVSIYDGFNGTGNLVETITGKIFKRPFKRSELDSSYSPMLSGSHLATHALASVPAGAAYTVSYALPANTAYARTITSLWAGMHWWGNNNGSVSSVASSKYPALNKTSVAFSTTAPSWAPATADTEFTMYDCFKRTIRVVWLYQ